MKSDKGFLVLSDVIVNLGDLVAVLPRFEVLPPAPPKVYPGSGLDPGGYYNKPRKRRRGVAIYLRGKEAPLQSDDDYAEVMKQLEG